MKAPPPHPPPSAVASASVASTSFETSACSPASASMTDLTSLTPGQDHFDSADFDTVVDDMKLIDSLINSNNDHHVIYPQPQQSQSQVRLPGPSSMASAGASKSSSSKKSSPQFRWRRRKRRSKAQYPEMSRYLLPIGRFFLLTSPLLSSPNTTTAKKFLENLNFPRFLTVFLCSCPTFDSY